ncbi:C-type lectin domain family 2 member B isoform X3 [Pteropus medius]|uniref:C-type lectin domain family 2 member B isoform X3 n=1 Tax=Pteropus vampyrus TaxID=132908 RepID=UPI00196B3619|nr:C-type lectin domain family 2 member B isoform X3 [Pteropus giganteus]
MAQSISIAALDEGMSNPNNSSQETDGTKRGFYSKHKIVWSLHRCCQDGWIGFQNNCYYFSKQEGDWNSSRYNCSIQHADLTVINNKEEMNFLRQHKCTSDHWIGLHMTESQTGKWINGIIFNKWFDVRGNEKCAYLSDDGTQKENGFAGEKKAQGETREVSPPEPSERIYNPADFHVEFIVSRNGNNKFLF